MRLGAGLLCDSVPDIITDPGCELTIGRNVLIRRGVEFRATGHSKIIIEDDVRIDRGVRFLAANDAIVRIGRRTRIGCHTVINGGDSVSVGSQCLIAGFVVVQSSMHRHRLGELIQSQGYNHAPVILESDVWIGAHAILMPGCLLGQGCIVGSNAVVTRNVGADEIAMGIPARVTKVRAP